MHEYSYRVECVSACNVKKDLHDTFRYIQSELSNIKLHDIIIETPQSLKDNGNNTYSFMIPFKNN